MFGIKSRTENWTTARTFAPIITFNQQFCIANKIIENHTGKNPEFKESEVRIELFAKGFRDYMHYRGIAQTNVGFIETIVKSYDSIFPLLRDRICDYIQKSKSTVGLTTIKDLKEKNYNSNDKTNLFNNIKNTEIDIVIETPRYLLIGEAKDEMSFGANSDFCLAHQLIRQYVTARVLIEIQNLDVEVIPFIVGNDLNNNSQVLLMQYLGYLKSENIYTWSNIINPVNPEIFNSLKTE